jgi:hypothetical protein
METSDVIFHSHNSLRWPQVGRVLIGHKAFAVPVLVSH